MTELQPEQPSNLTGVILNIAIMRSSGLQDVKSVAWHPDGEVLVSTSYDDSIKLWMEEEDEWVCVQTLEGGLYIRFQ